ncbi:FAD-dependent monooxygenase [Catenovulum sp. 2E275]|uniref:FAD-dependent monooxygenase n=1 Tax=Catenovulum sp. 2E275 TaxID=2980497 RepID=UPI0021D36759|nr:FAD-dependent monooxygenase [Catenovulum sp. 2E275]MCU4677687.1 FAD-dependent monooxygenase [Catenovulum sp. 2E275]
MTQQYDIIIVGAGMVGASLAASLADTELSVLLIDKKITAFDDTINQPKIRVSSISKGSIDWLTDHQIWQQLNSERLQYYNQLSVNEAGKSQCHFYAKDLMIDNLGCFVENNHLQAAALKQNPFTVIEDQILSCQFEQARWHLKLIENQNVSATLIIAADGAQSNIRKFCNFAQQGWQYNQACYSALIQLTQPANMLQTWQSFNQNGAIAFLPLYQNYANLIVYQTPANIRKLSAKNQQDQQIQLKSLFANNLPEFTLLESASFPLQKMSVSQSAKNGVILVGDAAHTIHPLAGQGVNLGIRDIAKLAKIIKMHQNNLTELQSERVWHSYQRQRNADVQSMSGMMDIIFYAFASQNPLLNFLRNQAMNLVEYTQPLKQLILKQALGKIN